ncbi:MAG: SoxR reducing system RseC family protein [Bacteroidales bacterium]|nr:SoxR reducing system RseC family protein [Bacteroidales bacterium]
MSSASCIEQKGVIERIENGQASVRLAVFQACAHCHSKSACGVADESTRNIEIALPDENYSIGEQVMIGMKRHLGIRATFLAYVFPFLLVMIVLILLTTLHLNELLSGIFSLISLVPYFILLYLFRDRLDRTFTFTLRKAA